MPKYEIKFETPGADKSAQDLNKIADIAADVEKKLKAMDAAEQKSLKTQRVHGDESQQMARHLSELTKEAKAHGAQAEKVTGIKARWLDATNKLKSQIPGLSFVIGAAKNPLVALVAVIALFLDSLSKIKERLDALKAAFGDGKITTNFQRIGEIMAQGKIDAKELANQLERIERRGESPDERAGRNRADIERQLKLEADQDAAQKTIELAGVTDPVQRARIEARFTDRATARERRRADAGAAIAADQQFRQQDALRELQGRQPAEQALVEAARDRHRRQMELAALAEQGNLAEIQKELATIDGILGTPLLKRSIGQLQLTSAYGGESGLSQSRAAIAGALQNEQQAHVKAGFIRKIADADLAAAEGRFSTFTGSIVAAREGIRSTVGSRAAALADSQNARSLAPLQDRASAATVTAAEVEAALKEWERSQQAIIDTLKRISSQNRRQSQSD